MTAKFQEPNWPLEIDDVEAYKYLTAYHMGSRADFRRIPYDTYWKLQGVLVSDMVSAIPATDSRVVHYASLPTPFPPILLPAEFGRSPIDGNHRVAAARLRGDKFIRAYVPSDSWARVQLSKSLAKELAHMVVDMVRSEVVTTSEDALDTVIDLAMTYNILHEDIKEALQENYPKFNIYGYFCPRHRTLHDCEGEA